MSLAGENVWLSVALLRLTSDKRPGWRPLHVVSSAAGSSENFRFGVFVCGVIVCVCVSFLKKKSGRDNRSYWVLVVT